MTDYKESYEKFIEAQKNMYEAWTKAFKASEEDGKLKFPFFDPEVFFKSLEEGNMDIISRMSGTSREVYERMKESNATYYNMYKLWSDATKDALNDNKEKAEEAYKTWKEDFRKNVLENYMAFAPESVRGLSDKLMELGNSYERVMGMLWEPWQESTSLFNDCMVKAFTMDPSAYREFLEGWRETYKATFAKMRDMPIVGIWREHLETQEDSIDKYYEYVSVASDFWGRIFEIAAETTEQVFQDYLETLEEGKDIKTYDDFYEYWASVLVKSYDKLFLSDDFSKVAGGVVNAMSDFKAYFDKLMEGYLQQWPIPKNSDMESLYKTVYDLKKEVRSLKKEMDDRKKEKKSNGRIILHGKHGEHGKTV